MALLEIKNLNFGYANSGTIIKDISLEIDEGDFVVLCGPTGSGKTTLLKLLKPELTILGKKEGEILFNGKSVDALTPSESSAIGFVQQNTEHQTVTDKVWHEVAFGMENLGFSQPEMRRRLAEIMAYFGIDDIFEKNTAELSGGQKQIVALASVIVMNPKVLILDEPTSQLDPVAAGEFFSTVKKLNDELGLTIIITEHRLENVVPLCNKLCVIDEGKITAFGEVRDTIEKLRGTPLMDAMPGAARLFDVFDKKGKMPLTVREGKNYIRDNNIRLSPIEINEGSESSAPALTVKNACFRYSREGADILCSTNLQVNEKEIFCILGANASGKTTLLKAVSGLAPVYSGKIEIFGKNINKYKNQSLYNNCVALLPQNAESVFIRNTLREELQEVNADFDIIPYDLSYAADTHPYDLSGGEQQLAALAKVLASKPRLLLLDEPTKGLDCSAKKIICNVLKKLKEEGMTIIAVTHDVEFAAMCADRAAMFFRGDVTSIEAPHVFFPQNIFYTTSINKIAGANLITAEDVKKSAEAVL